MGFGTMALMTKVVIYGFSVEMSIAAYLLYRKSFKEETKQCILFSLAMGMGMFLLHRIAIELLSIGITVLTPNGKTDSGINIMTSSFWSIGLVIMYYISTLFVSAELLGRLLRKLFKKETLKLHTFKLGVIGIVWQVLVIAMVIMLYGAGSI